MSDFRPVTNPPFPRLPRFVLFLLAAMLARAIALGNPIIHVDEQFYFVVASRMAHGAIPYVDVWDRKSLGLFLLYLPAAALGPRWGILAYQLMALAAATATAGLIAALADRAGWRRGAAVAGLLYVVWIDFVDGQGGQAPVFYTALIAGAVLLAGPRPRGAGIPWARGIGAMALTGLALQVKYACVFEGAWIGLWLAWTAWRGGARPAALLGFAATLMLVAALPTLLALATYVAIGQADAFVYANFTSILKRGSDPLAETLGNLAQVMLCLAPLLVLALLGRAVRVEERGARDWGVYLRGWLLASLIGLLAFGSWFNHYALPVIAPAACCAAAFIGGGAWGRRIGIALLIVAAIASEALLASMPGKRGTPAEFARVVAAVGHGPGCLYVYSGEPMLYAASGRCTVTRYLFPSHLGLIREGGSIGVDQLAEISRIFAQRPAVVVMRPAYFDYGEPPAVHARMIGQLRDRGYRLRAALPLGRQPIYVFVAPPRTAPK